MVSLEPWRPCWLRRSHAVRLTNETRGPMRSSKHRGSHDLGGKTRVGDPRLTPLRGVAAISTLRLDPAVVAQMFATDSCPFFEWGAGPHVVRRPKALTLPLGCGASTGGGGPIVRRSRGHQRSHELRRPHWQRRPHGPIGSANLTKIAEGWACANPFGHCLQGRRPDSGGPGEQVLGTSRIDRKDYKRGPDTWERPRVQSEGCPKFAPTESNYCGAARQRALGKAGRKNGLEVPRRLSQGL